MKLIGIDQVYPVPDELDLPETVFKYREVNQFLFSSLLLNQVWLAKPDTFNDPFERERIFTDSPFGQTLSRCPVSCDHIPLRSWPLFRARDVMRGVIESFKAEQTT